MKGKFIVQHLLGIVFCCAQPFHKYPYVTMPNYLSNKQGYPIGFDSGLVLPPTPCFPVSKHLSVVFGLQQTKRSQLANVVDLSFFFNLIPIPHLTLPLLHLGLQRLRSHLPPLLRFLLRYPPNLLFHPVPLHQPTSTPI